MLRPVMICCWIMRYVIYKWLCSAVVCIYLTACTNILTIPIDGEVNSSAYQYVQCWALILRWWSATLDNYNLCAYSNPAQSKHWITGYSKLLSIQHRIPHYPMSLRWMRYASKSAGSLAQIDLAQYITLHKHSLVIIRHISSAETKFSML